MIGLSNNGNVESRLHVDLVKTRKSLMSIDGLEVRRRYVPARLRRCNECIEENRHSALNKPTHAQCGKKGKKVFIHELHQAR